VRASFLAGFQLKKLRRFPHENNGIVGSRGKKDRAENALSFFFEPPTRSVQRPAVEEKNLKPDG
jgi:hypothetical protein